MAKLFTPYKLRTVEFKNRIWVSPMCQYSAEDGIPNDWHFVHLASFARGGASLVIVEATAVVPEGRITPGDAGLWSDEHTKAWARIVKVIKEMGSVAGIQIAHAGRKAADNIPWEGPHGLPLEPSDPRAWQPVAPSPIPLDNGWQTPRELTVAEIDELVEAWVQAAKRALEAGFEVLELHYAHGYLAHEFLSPLTNERTDEYGGSFENRIRFTMRIAQAVRAVWPAHLPLLARLSATDWVEGGWDVEQSTRLSAALQEVGVDLIDTSSGGAVPYAKITSKSGYQVPFAASIKEDAHVPVGAVGLITDPQQAEEIVASGKADVVLLGRELLRDPHWPLRAATALKVDLPYWPKQYLWAKPKLHHTSLP